MKAHVISLPHRQDRRDAMDEQCHRLGIEPIYFEATNGKVAFPSEPRKLMRGHFGCLDSHKRLLESLHGTAAAHIILEDDAIIDESFPRWFTHSRELPTSWDLIYFGGNTTQMDNAVEVLPYSQYDKALNVLCTHAYLIFDRSIPALLEVLNSRQWKVDILFTEFQKVANCYITKQCLAWQAVSHSDITDQILDGNKLKY